jgi:hypothetical protein
MEQRWNVADRGRQKDWEGNPQVVGGLPSDIRGCCSVWRTAGATARPKPGSCFIGQLETELSNSVKMYEAAEIFAVQKVGVTLRGSGKKLPLCAGCCSYT